MYYFYLLRCEDGSLYSGYTTNLVKRERDHNSGKGSKYVYARGGGKIVYSEVHATLSNALKREAEVKRWPRDRKLSLFTSVITS